MAKGKYYTAVQPYLDDITEWARQGVKEEDIAKINLGIAYSTFRTYKEKHEELLEALEHGKRQPNRKVENSAFRGTQGHKETLTKTFKVKTVEYDPQTGRKIRETEELKDGKEEIYVPPNAVLIIFWLVNRMGKLWKNKRTDELTGDGLNINVELSDD